MNNKQAITGIIIGIGLAELARRIFEERRGWIVNRLLDLLLEDSEDDEEDYDEGYADGYNDAVVERAMAN